MRETSKESSVKKSNSFRSLSPLLAIMILLSGTMLMQTVSVSAQEAAGKEKETEKADSPVNVTSDRMVAEKIARLVTFTGNVVAERENSTLNADQVQIFFTENAAGNTENKSGKEESQKSKIDKIIATGNVVYTSEKRKAFADKAVYTSEDETLVLTGETPRLTTENSFIEGEKITLFQKTDQVVVEKGNKRRVNALINPEDTKQKE